ncbi:MAG: hypothetical protein ACYDBZ_09760 [Steroidobacteraceae bacterium]
MYANPTVLLSKSSALLRRASISMCLLGLCTGAHASPATYTASVVTDIKVGTHLFHNASVTITFKGDTTQIKPVLDSTGNPVVSGNCPGSNNPQASGPQGTGPYFFSLAKGVAALQVRSGRKDIEATFAPGQIFVAFDLCNGGVGFGSFTGPSGVEPGYPLAFEAGTAMSFVYNSPAPLDSSANVTGYAWSCIGFGVIALYNSPGYGGGTCTSPDPYPLKTDAGEVVLYMPYQDHPGEPSPHYGSVNRGIFSIVVDHGD